MQTSYASSAMTFALALAVGAIWVLGAVPEARGEPAPITAEPLTERQPFSGDVSVRITQALDGLSNHEVEMDDASHLVVVRFTIQPGVVFPWHTHPGSVLISVAEGDFVFLFAEDCVERKYGAGTALVDPGNTVHTSFNPSADTETVVIATLIGVPAEGALTIPVSEEEGVALDRKCGIDRDAIAAGHGDH